MYCWDNAIVGIMKLNYLIFFKSTMVGYAAVHFVILGDVHSTFSITKDDILQFLAFESSKIFHLSLPFQKVRLIVNLVFPFQYYSNIIIKYYCIILS